MDKTSNFFKNKLLPTTLEQDTTDYAEYIADLVKYVEECIFKRNMVHFLNEKRHPVQGEPVVVFQYENRASLVKIWINEKSNIIVPISDILYTDSEGQPIYNEIIVKAEQEIAKQQEIAEPTTNTNQQQQQGINCNHLPKCFLLGCFNSRSYHLQKKIFLKARKEVEKLGYFGVSPISEFGVYGHEADIIKGMMLTCQKVYLMDSLAKIGEDELASNLLELAVKKIWDLFLQD